MPATPSTPAPDGQGGAGAGSGAQTLLLVAARELTQDIRVRRQAIAALERGLSVSGLSIVVPGEQPLPLDGVTVRRVAKAGVSGGARSGAATGGQPGRGGALERELRGAYRLLRTARTTWRLLRAARDLAPSGIVHANELDTLVAGWWIARRNGSRLVYDAHELHAFLEVDPPRVWRALMLALERALARRADVVVTNCDAYADFLRDTFGLGHRPVVVLNAPERIDVLPEPGEPGPRLRAIYQAGPDQPTRPVSDIVLAAEHAPSVELAIRVVTFDREAIQRMIDDRGLGDRVRILDPVPVDGLVTGLAGFDVGIILLRPLTTDSRLSQPGKLLEYMMGGLAVVVPDLPGMAPTVLEHEIGLVYRNDSPAELGAALERLAGDRSLVAAMRERARRLALDEFNFEAEKARLAEAWALPAASAGGEG